MSDVCPDATPVHPGGMVGGIEFIYWPAKVGKSRPTGFRRRLNGMMMTVNVEGQLFVTDEEIVRFWQRAKKGRFAKTPRDAAAEHKKKKKVSIVISQLLAMPYSVNYAANS